MNVFVEMVVLTIEVDAVTLGGEVVISEELEMVRVLEVDTMIMGIAAEATTQAVVPISEVAITIVAVTDKIPEVDSEGTHQVRQEWEVRTVHLQVLPVDMGQQQRQIMDGGELTLGVLPISEQELISEDVRVRVISSYTIVKDRPFLYL